MLKVLDHLEEWLITFLMGAATLIIFVAVVHRYVAGLPIPGVQDWLLGINLQLGAGAVHLHVRLDGQVRRRLRRAHRHPRRRRRADQPAARRDRAQVHRLRPARRRAVHRHRRHAGRALRLGERRALRRSTSCSASTRATCPEGPTTPDLEMPTWIVYSAVPLGSYLMCFRFLQVTWASCAPASCRTTTTPRSKASSRRRAAAGRPETRSTAWTTTCGRATGDAAMNAASSSPCWSR